MAISEEGRARRIVDYLNDGEELGIEGAVGSTPPRSPLAARLSLPRFRWQPRLSRLGSKGGTAKDKTVVLVEEEEVVADKSEELPAPVSTSVEQAAARTCEPASTSGASRPEFSMTLSLVFMLAKASSEVNKMVEVRTEVEALLRQVKHLNVKETGAGSNGHHDGTMPESGNRDSTTSSCVTDRNDRSAHLEEERAVSSGVNAASCDKSSPSEDDGDCYERGNGLEEEFHAEMERLQVNYGSDIPLFAAEEEHDSEVSDDINDYRHEEDDEGDDELGEIVEDENDDISDDDDQADYSGGVSALELERRLHELLHQRNRDRIQELESALRRAEKKLAEKEMEVCLWKDTAKFALRRENELQ